MPKPTCAKARWRDSITLDTEGPHRKFSMFIKDSSSAKAKELIRTHHGSRRRPHSESLLLGRRVTAYAWPMYGPRKYDVRYRGPKRAEKGPINNVLESKSHFYLKCSGPGPHTWANYQTQTCLVCPPLTDKLVYIFEYIRVFAPVF